MKKIWPGLLAIAFFGISANADAVPIVDGDSITTTIYGDARDGSPGDLAVDITIVFSIDQATGNLIATWTVAISPETMGDYSANPLRIHGFGFNLGFDGGVIVTADGDWDVGMNESLPGTGAGGMTLEFLLCQANGNNFNCTGNTDPSLVFTMTFDVDCVESPASCDTDMFFDAEAFAGDYIPGDGTGQMGAHIIGFNGDCSGAVGGMYDESLNTPGDGFNDGQEASECRSVSVPEPGTMGLLGLGLLGLALTRRRRSFSI